VVHAREVGLAGAEDVEILDFAHSEIWICITLDHDFHGILAETGPSQPSVILLRAQQTGYVATAEMVARLLKEFPGTAAGNLCFAAKQTRAHPCHTRTAPARRPHRLN